MVWSTGATRGGATLRTLTAALRRHGRSSSSSMHFQSSAMVRKDSSMIAANDRSNHFQEVRRLSSSPTPKQMEDEYGEMTSEGATYTYPGPFELESREVLEKAELRYMTYGQLNEARDNVLVVCHALTAQETNGFKFMSVNDLPALEYLV
eukprot:scaffold421307_cov50-Attheya_sp.AAC.1